jgi:hypothetical protein
VLARALHTDAPVVRAVHVGDAARAVIEARVDRTWRPEGLAEGPPEVGLAVSWSFPQTEPKGVPAIRAPLPR